MEEKPIFFQAVIVDPWLCSKEWLHTHGMTTSTYWIQWIIKEEGEMKLRRRCGKDQGRAGGSKIWPKYIMYMYEILRE